MASLADEDPAKLNFNASTRSLGLFLAGGRSTAPGTNAASSIWRGILDERAESGQAFRAPLAGSRMRGSGSASISPADFFSQNLGAVFCYNITSFLSQ